ncbi:MAG: Lrp/AsnC family transcriptional regulator [Actinomycetia bacterium]|nr:Lrp/AsnC family transcriptional regulator [Actinomycetes bacterium]
MSPSYRRRGIGRELYDLRQQICDELGLAGIVAGRVIPGFAEHKHMMSSDDYIAEVRAGRLYDSTLTFQPENGFKALCALANYVTDPAKLGLGFQAQLDMTVSDDARKVAAEVGGHDDAVYVVMTAGRYDLIAEVVCRDSAAFIDHSNTFRTLAGVASVDLLPYLDITTQTYDWGVG